jgi:hypothetical protein
MKWNEYEVSSRDKVHGFKLFYVHKYKGWALVKAFVRALPNLRIRSPFQWPFYFDDPE